MGFESHIGAAAEGVSNPNNGPLMRDIHGKLQAFIALKHFQDSHHDVVVDPYHPENNSSEVRNSAIREFITEGYAARFGDYREAHLDDQIHLDNQMELDQLYHTIIGETLH